MTAFEFLGGMVPTAAGPGLLYGALHALVDCPDHQVAIGSARRPRARLSSATRSARHDPVGWPTFKDWPHHDSLTHEQTYYKWVERAWMGGLRGGNLFVENRALCDVDPLKAEPLQRHGSVRLQSRDPTPAR